VNTPLFELLGVEGIEPAGAQSSVAVKLSLFPTKAEGIDWLKLNVMLPPAATVTGVTGLPVLTHVVPQVMSKLRDGFVCEVPTMWTRTETLFGVGLLTKAVQV